MALSGNFSTNTYKTSSHGTIGLNLSWTGIQNIANNTTTIKWTLKSNGSMSSGYYVQAGPVTVTINGTKVLNTTSRFNMKGDGAYKKTGSITVSHDNYGNKSVSMSVKAAIYSASVNCTASKTYVLDQIPRATLVKSAPDFNDTENPTVIYENTAGDSVVASWIGLSFDSAATDPVMVVDYDTEHPLNLSGESSYTFNLTQANRDALLAEMSTVKSKTIYYVIKSEINDGTFRYMKLAKTFSVVDANPILNDVFYEVDDLNVIAITENPLTVIQNQSSIQIRTNEPIIQKEATLTSCILDMHSPTGTLVTTMPLHFSRNHWGVTGGVGITSYTDHSGNVVTDKRFFMLSLFKFVANGDTITLSSNTTMRQLGIAIYNSNLEFVNLITSNDSSSISYTASSDIYVRCDINYDDAEREVTDWITLSEELEIQLEYGNSRSEYEEPKNNGYHLLNKSVITMGGNYSLRLTVIDSRGNKTASTTEMPVLEWSQPSADINLRREAGFYDDTLITTSCRYQSIDGKNQITIICDSKKVSDADYDPSRRVYLRNNPSNPDYDTIVCDNKYDWNVRIAIIDQFAEQFTVYELYLGAGIPLVFFDKHKNSVGINCLPDNSGSIEIGSDHVRIPHVYSTNEQIVGYWVDGSPIYEQTLLLSSTVTLAANASTNIMNWSTPIQPLECFAFRRSNTPVSWGMVGIALSNGHLQGVSPRDSAITIDGIILRYYKPT